MQDHGGLEHRLTGHVVILTGGKNIHTDQPQQWKRLPGEANTLITTLQCQEMINANLQFWHSQGMFIDTQRPPKHRRKPRLNPISDVYCLLCPVHCEGLHVLDLFWHRPEMLNPTAIWGPWRPVRCHFWAFCGLPVCSVLLMGVNTVRECRCLRGYTWSETVSGKVVHVKKHLHNCQDPRFPRRTWQCNKMMLLL